ncbi:hypothetical protein HPP92_017595 [Vanilla planifolia]|uniref:Uncharacterized protein n=1 Tax=Vanilla planifolia TaxID=51239 RepID=A0A835QI17_VANPL|nr:hypothetical protein HPP92_017595 [Vanilla planifolia]
MPVRILANSRKGNELRTIEQMIRVRQSKIAFFTPNVHQNAGHAHMRCRWTTQTDKAYLKKAPSPLKVISEENERKKDG